jgi:hypothetical protein
VKGANSQCRTASKIANHSTIQRCSIFRRAMPMAWLSLDHLRLPADKSLVNKNNKLT